MKRKVILLRDHSEESETAENILRKSKIEFTQLFSSSEGRLPSILSPNSAYAYEGIEGVNLFISISNEK